MLGRLPLWRLYLGLRSERPRAQWTSLDQVDVPVHVLIVLRLERWRVLRSLHQRLGQDGAVLLEAPAQLNVMILLMALSQNLRGRLVGVLPRCWQWIQRWLRHQPSHVQAGMLLSDGGKLIGFEVVIATNVALIIVI